MYTFIKKWSYRDHEHGFVQWIKMCEIMFDFLFCVDPVLRDINLSNSFLSILIQRMLDKYQSY